MTKLLRPPPFVDLNNKDVARLLDQPQLPGVTRLLDLAKYKSSLINKNTENEKEQQFLKKNENTPPKSLKNTTTPDKPIHCNENAVENEDYWLKEMVCNSVFLA